MHPVSRLHLAFVPADPDLRPPAGGGEGALRELLAGGLLGPGGAPGRRADALVPGGYRRWLLDRPPGPTVWGNRVGGFQVRCPACGAPMARPLARAMAAWKAGGDRRTTCPACGASLDAAHLETRPPAAAGWFALVLREVRQPDPAPGAAGLLAGLLGPGARVVAWRA